MSFMWQYTFKCFVASCSSTFNYSSFFTHILDCLIHCLSLYCRTQERGASLHLAFQFSYVRSHVRSPYSFVCLFVCSFVRLLRSNCGPYKFIKEQRDKGTKGQRDKGTKELWNFGTWVLGNLGTWEL